jgi:hypothetical protein
VTGARDRGVTPETGLRRILAGRRITRRQAPALVVAVAMLLVATTVAGAAVKDFLHPRPYPPKVLMVRGKIKMSNSRGNTAILSMKDMQPGDSVSGNVTIGNRSRTKAHFWLKKVRLRDQPGPLAGQLSRFLVLEVMQFRAPRPPRVLYRGPLADMPTLYLGKFRPRRRVTYMFTVSLPVRGPALDSSIQQSGTSVGFRWYASRAR